MRTQRVVLLTFLALFTASVQITIRLDRGHPVRQHEDWVTERL